MSPPTASDGGPRSGPVDASLPSSTAPVIRSPGTGDLAEVLALLAAAELPQAGVEQHFARSYAVAAEGDRVLGAAGVERYGSHGLLRSVVVEAGMRGRGIGEALVRDRLRWSASAGLETVFLLTTTAPGFFSRLGFDVVERSRVPAPVQASPEFSSICPGDAVVMRLRLTYDNSMKDIS